MNEESIEEKDRKQMEKEPLRWYIGVLADGTYRFIQPGTLWKAARGRGLLPCRLLTNGEQQTMVEFPLPKR